MRRLISVSLCLVVALGAYIAPAASQDGGGDPEIVNGSPLTAPFMVALRYQGQPSCGGTLISRRRVLTAAHCLKNRRLSDFRLVMGTDRPASGGTVRQIDRVWVHPNYNFTTASPYDLAVIRLSSAVGSYPAIPLVGPEDSGLWAPGVTGLVAGWGRTSLGSGPSPVLRGVWVPILSDAECAARASASGTGSFVADKMICAGSSVSTAGFCVGDSGGPLIVGDPEWRQAGIVSWFHPDSPCASPTGVAAYTELGAPGIALSNDRFTSATVLPSSGGTVRSNNAIATKELNEPNHAGNRGGASIWYRWAAPNNNPVTIKTVGSDFDTTLAVYRGTSVSSLSPVASNDNIDTGVRRTSKVRFTPTAGTEYRIAVDGWSDSMGNVTLGVSSSAPAPTLGVVWAPNQDGFGEVRPDRFYGGGSPLGLVEAITWDSWGGSQATGTGTGYYGDSGASARPEPARIVASDLGICHGQQAYRQVDWYFPNQGQHLGDGGHFDICPA